MNLRANSYRPHIIRLFFFFGGGGGGVTMVLKIIMTMFALGNTLITHT